MNYTFEEAEQELDNLFDKLIDEANTYKEKYYLRNVWETFKQGKLSEDESDTFYWLGYEDGRDSMRTQYED